MFGGPWGGSTKHNPPPARGATHTRFPGSATAAAALLLLVLAAALVATFVSWRGNDMAESAARVGGSLTVVVMTYKRHERLHALLQRLSVVQSVNSIRSLRLIVTQSCDGLDSAHVEETASVLRAASARFERVVHVLTPNVNRDNSFTVGKQFGSKLNSMRNLWAGLHVAMHGQLPGTGADPAIAYAPWSVDSARAYSDSVAASGASRSVLVLEDDIVMADDMLAFFDFAQIRMDMDPTIEFACGTTLWRPNILVGVDDVSALTRARAAWQGTDAAPALVDRHVGTYRTVFKTLAWMISAEGWKRLQPLYASMIAFQAEPEDVQVDVLSRSGALVARTTHPELAGCLWCNNYCYDHAIEWLLQGRPYLAPMLHRATQASGAGMTSVDNEVLDIYTGPPVPAASFTLARAAVRLLRFFRMPGASCVARIAGHSGVRTSELVSLYLYEPLLVILLVALLVGATALLYFQNAGAEALDVGYRKGGAPAAWPPCWRARCKQSPRARSSGFEWDTSHDSHALRSPPVLPTHAVPTAAGAGSHVLRPAESRVHQRGTGMGSAASSTAPAPGSSGVAVAIPAHGGYHALPVVSLSKSSAASSVGTGGGDVHGRRDFLLGVDSPELVHSFSNTS
ncbi:hypothetical protein EON68_00480, partial [archaeon]